MFFAKTRFCKWSPKISTMQKEALLLLNIESSSEFCSVALSRGAEVVSFAATEEKFAHAKSLTLLIEKCLSEKKTVLSDLAAVAVSRGPGSYTALRVGSSVGKGICYALNKPLIAVDTLKSLATAAYALEKDDAALYVPMIDARRMEVYTAQFGPAGKRLSETSADIITENSYKNIFKSEKKVIFCGGGAEKCRSVIQSPFAHYLPVVCSALHLPSLSLRAYTEKRFEDTAYFEPEYFKAPNITKSKKKLF